MKNQVKGNEIILDDLFFIVSKTNEKGIISYVNDYFCQVSGYSQEELINKNHNIVRHPDMPKCVFKFMWDRIQSGKNLKAVVKNRAKDGKYYWVITDFTIEQENGKKIYMAKIRKIDAPIKKTFEKLYKQLKKIEDYQGMDVAFDFFVQMIEKEGFADYDDFIEHRLNRKFLGILRY